MSERPDSYIELRKNHDGADRAYLAGTRVRVQDVYALSEIQGQTPDEIAVALPHLTLAQIYAALAYYFDHRQDILREIQEDREFAVHLQTAAGKSPLLQRTNPPAA